IAHERPAMSVATANKQEVDVLGTLDWMKELGISARRSKPCRPAGRIDRVCRETPCRPIKIAFQSDSELIRHPVDCALRIAELMFVVEPEHDRPYSSRVQRLEQLGRDVRSGGVKENAAHWRFRVFLIDELKKFASNSRPVRIISQYDRNFSFMK